MEATQNRDELRPVQEVITAHLGKPVSGMTLWRWREIGVGGVRLECFPAGRSWLTTPAHFSEFVHRQALARREGGRDR